MSPPLSDLAQVVHGNGDFSSKLISLVDRNPGEVLAKIEGTISASQRAYTSVQVSEDADIELNSDLVFCNHSCSPSVLFDMANVEVRVAGDKPLKKGEDVTFFYPSTEWDMEQPFQCGCGSQKCIGVVQGAKYLDESVLKQYWLNSHIDHLLSKRKASDASGHLPKQTIVDDAARKLKN